MAAPSRTAWTPANATATTVTINAPGGTPVPAGSFVTLRVSSDTASTVPTHSPGTNVPTGDPTFVTLMDDITADNGSGASTVYSEYAWIAPASPAPTSYTVNISISRFTWVELVYFTPDSGSWSSVQDALDNALSSGALQSTDWAKSTTSTEPTLPTLTTLGTDRRVDYAVTWDEGKTFNSAPTGTSNVYATATSTNAQRGDDKTQAVAGTTGSGAYDISSGTRWVGRTLMVKNPSAGTTVTPGAGSLSLAGFAPTVVNAAIVTPGAGSLALTGQAPLVKYQTNVDPGLGSLSLTGFAPTVTVLQIVQPGAGSLSLTGFAPSLLYDTNVTPGAGSLSLTGFAPTVLTTTTVSAGLGSLSLAGLAPTLSYVAPVFPGVGALSLTGYAPTILQITNLTPGVGSLTLSGFAPAIGWDRLIRLVPVIGDLEPMRRILNDILAELQRQSSYYGDEFPVTPGDGQMFVKAGALYQYQAQTDTWEGPL